MAQTGCCCRTRNRYRLRENCMMLSDLIYRFRALFRRIQLNAELDQELQDHVERETEKYVRSGLPVEEARLKVP